MNKRFSVFCGCLFLFCELALLPKAVDLFLDRHLASLSTVEILTLSMTFGSILLCIVMSFSAISENKNHPLPTFLFELMVFLCCLAPLTDLFTKALDTAGEPFWNMVINTLFYLVGINIAYVILLYACLMADPIYLPRIRTLRRIATLIMLLDNLTTLCNIPFGYYFVITPEGAYQSAPTYYLAYLAPLAIIGITMYVALRYLRPGRPRLAFLLFWAFALSASVLQMVFSELTLQYTGYTLSLIVIQIFVQSELDTFGLDAEHNAEEGTSE